MTITDQAPSLAAIILTLNEARHIQPCIESMAWATQTIVLDSFSTDNTVFLAREAGAQVHQHAFENYSQQRNVALGLTEAEWIFFIDADERATLDLGAEIHHAITHHDKVGWWVPRYNYILGHRMRGAGWWPDHQLRILRRTHARYDPQRAVHEVATLDGPAGYLETPLIHYNYETLQQFIEKQRRYTDYDASILEQKGLQTRAYTPYTQALRHFWWRFVQLDGWRDGVYGILLSTLMAHYELVKYKKLRERAHT